MNQHITADDSTYDSEWIRVNNKLYVFYEYNIG